MDSLNGHIMNLANSIIGVSVLAMPYCFKQCGIILSVLLLIVSSIVSRLTCHFLLKSAILCRRKTFEFLAFHLFGGLGKLFIEIGMIGFLLGTCIAYFVVMGDLGPVIVSEITKFSISSTMHTSILFSLALFIVLPLGLLRNVHSLNGVSRATMIFYCCLVVKVIIEALPHLFEDNWYNKVNLWRPEGLLQCIPIFSMALFCQTQLFEIYEVVPNVSLEKMNSLVKAAVNFCTAVYICVGIFGYVAFSNKNFTGNILLSFEPSFISHIIKVGFIFSVAFSFPLVIFPCRASLYSLLYKEGYSIHEGNLNYIPESKFKVLTFVIVSVSLVIAILIPNIELVLGLVGSTIGVMVCVLFPVTCFICLTQKNTNERIIAQIILALGIFVMVVGTYKNVQRVDELDSLVVTVQTINQDKIASIVEKLPLTEKLEIKTKIPKIVLTKSSKLKEIRHEPPQPVEPIEEDKPKIFKPLPMAEENPIIPKPSQLIEPVVEKKPKNLNKEDEIAPIINPADVKVDIEAIKKEDKEEQLEMKPQKEQNLDEHKKLIDTIQQQNEVQKEIVEQQKQLLEVIKQQQKREDDKKMDEVKQEKMKAVKEIESIALKAIEKISDGENSQKVVNDLKKGIEKNEQKIKNDEDKNEENKKVAKTPEENKKAKEFEKKVDNFKVEIQELSSQLNQADIDIKNKESPPNKIKEGKIIEPKDDIIINEANKNKLEQNPKLEDIINPNKLSLTDSSKNGNNEVNPLKLLPLPIAMSNNLVKANITNTKKENIKKEIEDVQAVRRDSLSVDKEM